MPDLGTSGRIRMFRAPDWVGDGTYRQQAFVMQTDGQLGHLWWRNRAWRYQTIHVDQGATEGEATMPAVGMVAPQFLTDGTYGGWHQMNPSPGGSLVYVGTTDSKLWSVLPTRSEDSFCWGSLHSPDSVWLRSVSGASGMPIGWTYEPTTEAYPLTPGVHTGNACFGIWDQTYEECAARVRSANRGPRAKCGQAPEDACAFLQPFPIDIPFGEPSANVPRPTPRADPLARVANAPSPAAAEFVVERGAPNGPDPSRATRPAVQIESGARLRTFHDKIEVIGPQRPPLLAPRRSGQAALKPATTRPSGFMARSVKALLADSDDAAPVLDRAVDFGRKRCTCDRQCGSGNPSGAETHVSGACQMCSRSAGVSPEPLVRGAEAAPARVAARPGLIPAAACRAMIPMPAKSHTTFPILVPIPTLPEQVQIASRRG